MPNQQPPNEIDCNTSYEWNFKQRQSFAVFQNFYQAVFDAIGAAVTVDLKAAGQQWLNTAQCAKQCRGKTRCSQGVKAYCGTVGYIVNQDKIKIPFTNEVLVVTTVDFVATYVFNCDPCPESQDGNHHNLKGTTYVEPEPPPPSALT